MFICFQLACFSHLFYSWSLHTYIPSLSFAIQDIAFSLLSLGSLEKRGVGNNGIHLWDITYCVFSVRFFRFDFFPLLASSPPLLKNILFPPFWPSGAVSASVLQGKNWKMSLCISKLKVKNFSSSHRLEAVWLKFCRSVGGSFKTSQNQSWAKDIFMFALARNFSPHKVREWCCAFIC